MHAFDEAISHCPSFDPARRTTLYHYDTGVGIKGHGFLAEEWRLPGQWGTHVDPPAHFVRGLRFQDEIPVAEMVLPLVVLDVSAQAARDPPAEPFLLSLSPEHGPARLWLRDAGTADQQLAITFVARCAETFGLTGRWGFQWANIASNSVVDGFSGGAHVLDLSTGRALEWISTRGWLADRLSEGGTR